MSNRSLVTKGRQVRGWIRDFFPTSPVIERDGTYLMTLSLGVKNRDTRLSDEGRQHLFNLIKGILEYRLQAHPIVDSSSNHVSWGDGETSEGEPYHVLLSRGCRGTMSVEVRPGKK
jgi:hypothetical protein